MKLALQIISWIAIVIGVLAIIGSGNTGVDSLGNPAFSPYALIGGLLFFSQGLLSILYIKQQENF